MLGHPIEVVLGQFGEAVPRQGDGIEIRDEGDQLHLLQLVLDYRGLVRVLVLELLPEEGVSGGHRNCLSVDFRPDCRD